MELLSLDNVNLVFESYPVFFYIVILVFGLTVGSFLNVVIYRLPVMMEQEFLCACTEQFGPFKDKSLKDKNLKSPRENSKTEQNNNTFNLAVPASTCPNCGHKIRAWENIPVISWLVLKAKCSSCSTPISARYPAIEFLTGILSVFVAVHFGVTEQTLYMLIFLWCLIALTFIDLDKMYLPDQITLPLMWLGLLLSLNDTFVTPIDAILGASLGYLSLWSVFWGFKLLTGKEGFGYGDFKLLAAMGAWMGYTQLPVIIILSSFVGAVFGIVMIVTKINKKGQPIPFGPYLAIAGLIAFFYGDTIIQMYLNMVLGS